MKCSLTLTFPITINKLYFSKNDIHQLVYDHSLPIVSTCWLSSIYLFLDNYFFAIWMDEEVLNLIELLPSIFDMLVIKFDLNFKVTINNVSWFFNELDMFWCCLQIHHRMNVDDLQAVFHVDRHSDGKLFFANRTQPNNIFLPSTEKTFVERKGMPLFFNKIKKYVLLLRRPCIYWSLIIVTVWKLQENAILKNFHMKKIINDFLVTSKLTISVALS